MRGIFRKIFRFLCSLIFSTTPFRFRNLEIVNHSHPMFYIFCAIQRCLKIAPLDCAMLPLQCKHLPVQSIGEILIKIFQQLFLIYMVPPLMYPFLLGWLFFQQTHPSFCLMPIESSIKLVCIGKGSSSFIVSEACDGPEAPRDMVVSLWAFQLAIKQWRLEDGDG